MSHLAPAIFSATTGVSGAPHVVVVHGSLDRSAGLLKLSRRLDDTLRVTRYDRRGYGRSTPCTGPYGMDRQVADLVEVIERAPLTGSPCVLFGHSYGGNVVLATAQRRPDLVAGVIVYESPLSWLDWWPGISAGAGDAAWADDPPQAAERFMRRLIGDARWDRLPAATRQARRDEGPALVGELDDLRANAPWAPGAVGVPVQALHGEHALAHHRLGMGTVAEWFGRPAIEIAGAHHFGPNTHPDAVAGVVIDFVRGLAG